MKTNEHLDRGVTIITVNGRIDGDTAELAEQKILPRVDALSMLVIDLQMVDYVSSAGLRVLLKAAKSARATTTDLMLAALTPPVQEVFDLSGFSQIFDSRPTTDEAVTVLLQRDTESK